MNKTLNNIIMFAVGAAIGSAVAWKLVKDKYDQIARDEIESMKEYYSTKQEHEEKDICEEQPVSTMKATKEKPNIMEYAAKLQEQGYTDYKNITEPAKKEVDYLDKPYVIAPEEFGELDDYELIGLTYYADGVLADDMDEIVEDVDDIVGEESLTHFGQYEDDSVFVRNDRLKCDYEILRDEQNYSDVKPNPHPAEDE